MSQSKGVNDGPAVEANTYTSPLQIFAQVYTFLIFPFFWCLTFILGSEMTHELQSEIVHYQLKMYFKSYEMSGLKKRQPFL